MRPGPKAGRGPRADNPAGKRLGAMNRRVLYDRLIRPYWEFPNVHVPSCQRWSDVRPCANHRWVKDYYDTINTGSRE